LSLLHNPDESVGHPSYSVGTGNMSTRDKMAGGGYLLQWLRELQLTASAAVVKRSAADCICCSG